MKILLTGATGLIGKEVGKVLVEQGHELVVISRSLDKARQHLPFACQVIEHDLNKSPLKTGQVQGVEAVVHLAGESVAGGRWNEKIKKEIYNSRVVGTKNLLAGLPDTVKTLIASSAIGIYGDRGDEALTESSSPGNDFLAQVCLDWEKASESFKGRRVLLRTGVVLSPQGGALEKMLFPFRAGVGGKLGSGRQWMSWIHIEDMVRLIAWTLTNQEVAGVVNAVSPHPRQNEEFSRTLAGTFGFGLGPAVPGFALKALFGEMSTVLLASQRVLPKVALGKGFHFKFIDLKSTFSSLFSSQMKGEEIFYAEQFVPLSPEELFPFFSAAKNLEEITPDILNFKVKRVSTNEIQQGTLIDYVLKIHGVPAKWKTLIDEWNPPFKFVDNQLKGPYKLWHHTHEFKAVPGGTLMTDRVRYILPFGKLGWYLAWHFVRRDVESIFAYRRKVVSAKF